MQRVNGLYEDAKGSVKSGPARRRTLFTGAAANTEGGLGSFTDAKVGRSPGSGKKCFSVQMKDSLSGLSRQAELRKRRPSNDRIVICIQFGF